MSGQPLSQYEYTLQQIVMLFGELLIQLDKAGLTHTYHNVICFCEFENIGYLVFRYLITGQPPFDEWAEEWLHDGEV
jgi:hypothetical protein